MRPTTAYFLCLVFVASHCGPPAFAAGRCELAVEPAATLLLPYFEVDLDDPGGLTTIFSINNARGQAALAHVTVWTDYGIPTVNFDVFLTGYDVATLNLRNVFDGGFLPVTAGAVSDPDDRVSPHGVHPDWDGDFEFCDQVFPYPEPVIGGALRERMSQGHRGAPVPQSGDCLGRDHGDRRVRGYVTVDVVNSCGFLFPSDEGYFGDRGTGVAGNANQLWGDFYLMDPAQGFAQGEPLVHVQAFDGVGEDGAWQDGDKTFYGRYVGGSAIDNREPLPSVFAVRYLNSDRFAGSTELLIWRDTESPATASVACDETPEWSPLFQRRVFDFDEQERVVESCYFPGCGVCSPPIPPFFLDCAPLATQRVAVTGDSSFEPGFHSSGWLYLDLNRPDAVSQAWVSAILSASGVFSVGLPAAALASSCDGLPEEPEITPYHYY